MFCKDWKKKKLHETKAERKDSKITGGRGDIITDLTEIERNISSYCEQLDTSKLSSLACTSKCLKAFNAPRLSQDLIENLSNS